MNRILFLKQWIVGVLVFTTLLTPAGIVRAETYQVSAEVPYDIPTNMAVIQSPSGSLTVDTAMQNISGTCEAIAPSAIVSIWRNGQSVGSSVCQLNGTFSLTLQLTVGINELLPRTSNISNIYGPDGAVLRITYQLPAEPASSLQTPPSQQQPAELASQSDLAITSVLPFGVLAEADNSVTVQIVIKGSAAPFDILINWGDGTTDKKSIPAAGTYSFSHTYDKSATYSVRATVTDVLGASIEYVIPVVPTSTSKPPTEVTNTKATETRTDISSYIPYLAGITVIAGLAFFAGSHFNKSGVFYDPTKAKNQGTTKSNTKKKIK